MCKPIPNLLQIGFFLSLIMISACRSTGPTTVVRDRTAYIDAISDSWKKQLLLNIVKLRYADAPIFLDVSSIVSQYEITGQVNAGVGFEQNGTGWHPSIGAQANFADRPTITYTPFTGTQFSLNLMRPVLPKTLMSIIYAGYPVDYIFKFAVNSVNGIKNSFGGQMRKHDASPEFYPLLERLRKVQDADALLISLGAEDDELSFSIQNRYKIEQIENVHEINKLLGLPDSVNLYRIGYGLQRNDSTEFVLMTRSFMEILIDIGSSIEVPEEHLTGHQVLPSKNFTAPDGSPINPFIRIRSGKEQPGTAFFSVLYNGYWFYIDQGDYTSKAMFSFILTLGSLTETNEEKSTPLITIPTR